jgi:hypothetical protein
MRLEVNTSDHFILVFFVCHFGEVIDCSVAGRFPPGRDDSTLRKKINDEPMSPQGGQIWALADIDLADMFHNDTFRRNPHILHINTCKRAFYLLRLVVNLC